MNDIDYTRKFSVSIDKDQEIRMILSSVRWYPHQTRSARTPPPPAPPPRATGPAAVSQQRAPSGTRRTVPTYITNHNNARTLIRQLDRDELLQVLLKSYLHEKCPRSAAPARWYPHQTRSARTPPPPAPPPRATAPASVSQQRGRLARWRTIGLTARGILRATPRRRRSWWPGAASTRSAPLPRCLSARIRPARMRLSRRPSMGILCRASRWRGRRPSRGRSPHPPTGLRPGHRSR